MAVTLYSSDANTEYDIDSDNEVDEEVEAYSKQETNKTFQMIKSVERFNGMIDEEDSEEAIRQTIFCILQTERYSCEIYSNNYGFEYQDLVGKDTQYICAVLPSRIKEALLVDDRIEDVTNFNMEINKKSIKVNFTVVTTDNDEIETETEVDISV